MFDKIVAQAMEMRAGKAPAAGTRDPGSGVRKTKTAKAKTAKATAAKKPATRSAKRKTKR
jgi:hypothetical protein